MLFAKEVADQLADTKLCAVSVHPGVIKTNLARYMSLSGVVTFLFEHIIVDKTIPQGASTTLYGCLEPSLDTKELRGSYLVDCAVAVPMTEAGRDKDKKLRQALWKATEADLADK
jgi:NAD(P)-dependent dehydrogenase (short-subunit alcohol dehydrogenase family)